MDTRKVYEQAVEQLKEIQANAKKRASDMMKKSNLYDVLFLSEMGRLLEHEPTTEEIAAAIVYVDGISDDFKNFGDISTALYDWRCSECIQCDWCGLWWLKDEMDAGIDGNFCDQNCHFDHWQEHGGQARAAFFEDWDA